MRPSPALLIPVLLSLAACEREPEYAGGIAATPDADADTDADSDADSDSDSDSDSDTDADTDADPSVYDAVYTGDFSMDATGVYGEDVCTGVVDAEALAGVLEGSLICSFAGPLAGFGEVDLPISGVIDPADGTLAGSVGDGGTFAEGDWSGAISEALLLTGSFTLSVDVEGGTVDLDGELSGQGVK